MEEFNNLKNRKQKIELQDQLLLLRKKAEKKLLKIPGVIHIGVAIKKKDGKSTDIPCLRVYVKRKLPLAEISDKHRIPAEIEGVPTDVVEITSSRFEADTKKYRPLIGGAQIMNSKWKTVTVNGATGTEVSYGTLGCFATRNSDNKVGLISNEHVLAFGGASTDDPIGQPSSPCESLCCVCGDIGKIATLVNDHSFVECGFAVLNDDVNYTNSVIDVGYIRGTAAPVLDEEVKKYGRTSGLTTGKVDDISGPSEVGGHIYTDQVIVVSSVAGTPFTQPGDSGAVYVNSDNKVIALHSTGAPESSAGNNISRVETALGVTVLATTAPAGVTPTAGYLTTTPAPHLADQLVEWEQELLAYDPENKLTYDILGARNEITYLLRHNREVKVAWNRCQGPAFVGHLTKAMQEEGYRVPLQIKGNSWKMLLIRMFAMLETHGSENLQRLIDRHAVELLQLEPDPKRIKDFLFNHITPESAFR